ncbi:MAG: HU family DNA-binding protein [Balneolaceae bacterium]
MKYSELIDQLADAVDLPKNKTKSLLEETTSILSDELSSGKGVSIPNLGTLTVKVNDIKKVYSPHHKKYMMVPPKRVVEFSPSTNLKDKLKFVRSEDE